MRILRKRSVWVLISAYMALWLVISLLAGIVLEGFKDTINASLGLKGFRVENTGTGDEDLEYYKSAYVQKDAQGNVLYTTDATGYKHQLYDDKALQAAARAKGREVQKEGTTILWNSESNGLPLSSGNKVSLFGYTSAWWFRSGTGSGKSVTSGASTTKVALTNAGLTVNNTLWSFYRGSSIKSAYAPTFNEKVNEVPWSAYTDAVKNSFKSYGDAAIVVLGRQGGEGAVTGAGYAKDAMQTGADTVSGDYFDLHANEREMLSQVISLKKAGTFKKVVVLLNTPTDIWFDSLFDYKADIDSCVWVGQTGFAGLDEVGNILVGKSIPSGHLVDTFLMNTRSNPAVVNSILQTYTNHLEKLPGDTKAEDYWYQRTYIVYAEGIYLGYKYYETRYEDAVLNQGNATSTAGAVNSTGNWKYSEEVAFPFGYGGAYTTFGYSNYKVEINANGDYVVTLKVTNTGNKRGADAVQVYIQKPYTEYDKQYKIEQAAVNLVGYAKTAELAPGASENVTITVRNDAFKTYDANNKKTYIREKGDYYLTVAQDAHDAVNNILAAKDKSPANTGGVMDAEGNDALVKKYNFTVDDFTSFSVGANNVAITNQFDDADWNKYENKTDTVITYLSRSDWQATYPTAPPKLTLNDEMVKDLGWNFDVEEKQGDKMPTYGATQVFNLIDMRGLDYNDPAWDSLLDQLTLQDQIDLLGRSYHGTGAVTKIAKPKEVVKDGPLGIRQNYKTNSTDQAHTFPSTTLLAATFNDNLALQSGEFMGEDMLHCGLTGLYAPGANLHRMTYAGRNFEYYSEDGFISGMMAKWQVIGVQSKGCYVNMKHFALNDQESGRHGIATFANEQSIREVYLPAFEYAVTEGDCTGIMSAFNRVGVKWAGAHEGLLKNVLRGEWGFDGFVISDCRWRVYMGVVDGVMAGNDSILYASTDLTDYYRAQDNATIAKGIRESAKRVLYVVANSNAMNGYSSNTKIYIVREWWQHLIMGVQIGLGALTALCSALAVVAFIFHNKIELDANAREEEIERAKQNGTYVGAGQKVKNFFCIGQAWGARRIATTVVCCLVAGAIAFTAIYLPIALTPPPEIPQTTYRFEAEMSNIFVSDSAFQDPSTYIGTEGLSLAEVNNPSNGQFVHHISHMKEPCVLTFTINSTEDATAILSACMGLREDRSAQNKIYYLKNMYVIKVNGVVVDFDQDILYPPYNPNSKKYYDWHSETIATINLNKGVNTIEFINGGTSAGWIALNFDFIELISTATLSWAQ